MTRSKALWDGRFDIPFGTPAGEYRVTVIVVHRDGTRTRFALLYQYLTGGPTVSRLDTLRAAPGGPFRLSVSGKGSPAPSPCCPGANGLI